MLFKCGDTSWEEAVEVTDGFSHDGLVLSVKGGFVEKMVAWCAGLVPMLPAFFFHPGVMQFFHAGRLRVNRSPT